jgi:hypothetical protein
MARAKLLPLNDSAARGAAYLVRHSVYALWTVSG